MANTLDNLYLEWQGNEGDESLEALLRAVRCRAIQSGKELGTDVEDFAQSVCTTVWLNLKTFTVNTADGFTRWINVIMRHEKLYRYRFGKHISSENMTEQAIESDEFIDIADLPAEMKKVATYLLSGYSLKETAINMNMNPATLRKKLERYRHKTSR